MSFKNSIKNVTIGSDPEMFLFSEKSEKFVPVCGLIGGTKEEPLPITNEGHFIQEDNVAVEFCIPPCKTSDEFLDHIRFVKEHISKKLEEKGLVLKCVASAHFDNDDLQSEQAQTFGCEPDFNAYTYMQNEIDKDNIDPTLRSAGFHIHVGYDNHSPEVSIALAKAFDLFVLVPSILMDPDTERRQLYGKAGCYRFKPKYGIELRGLSAYFVENAERQKWVWDQVMKAIDFVNEGGIITNEDDIQECINDSNKLLAKEIIEDYKVLEAA